MTERLESALIALACLFVIFAFAAFLAFLAHSTSISNQAVVDQVYSGWAGGVAQAVATALTGIFAILAGLLAYKGAVRAAQINYEAAAKQLATTQERERALLNFKARTLEATVMGEIVESMVSIDVEAMCTALKKPEIEMPMVNLIIRPKFLDMEVERVEVMGYEVVALRQSFSEQLDLLIKCYEAAFGLINRSASHMERIVHAAELEQEAAEARESALKLLVKLQEIRRVETESDHPLKASSGSPHAPTHR